MPKGKMCNEPSMQLLSTMSDDNEPRPDDRVGPGCPVWRLYIHY